MPKTLFEKLWDSHVVHSQSDEPDLLYIDFHLIHEVTSPQAFERLRQTGRMVRRPDLTFAVIDCNAPTINRTEKVADPLSAIQMKKLRANCAEFGIELRDINHLEHGIVHVIAPELGFVLPGKTIVCGDSYTTIHGAFGVFAFGIGTSEVEEVLVTQCLHQYKPGSTKVEFVGKRPRGVSAKDMVLGLIARFGTSMATGSVVEYTGGPVRELTMEERMTICGMSAELGARTGLIAPDETTFEYLRTRKYAPFGELWDKAMEEWKGLYTDEDATYDQVVQFNIEELVPQVTWGTTLQMGTGVTECVPDLAEFTDEVERKAVERALAYMDLTPGTKITDIVIDRVFIGSCPNARIEDLRLAADMIRGRKVADSVTAMVVPGSQLVKKQAEAEGLQQIFLNAGFEWREPGQSMGVAINGDSLEPGERCASTSSRNCEGCQGRGGRTHLCSPAMAAAAAIAGHFVDVRNW